ncbi:hypothetical protein ACOJBM_39770 [Rhizobium beringeri]
MLRLWATSVSTNWSVSSDPGLSSAIFGWPNRLTDTLGEPVKDEEELEVV